MEVRGNNRSVMPLDVLGRTRATLTEPASTSPWPKGLGNLVKLCRAGDRALQLLLFNEECLVSASHQLALITSLPFGFYLYEGLKENFSPVDNISAISSVCIEISHFGYLSASNFRFKGPENSSQTTRR